MSKIRVNMTVTNEKGKTVQATNGQILMHMAVSGLTQMGVDTPEIVEQSGKMAAIIEQSISEWINKDGKVEKEGMIDFRLALALHLLKANLQRKGFQEYIPDCPAVDPVLPPISLN